ncbi:MAG: mechanosensitive ion channel [Cyanobacteria bacterium]|nr:mechanosensitive ion channel [Cyanobacteriota bacterium]
MPIWVHELIEVDVFAGQTSFQLLFATLTFIVYAYFVFLLISRLIASHVSQATVLATISAQERLDGVWNEDVIAWSRVLCVLPILPLTTISKVFVDDYLNFTGMPLVVATYFFYVAWCGFACIFAFYLFEALGKAGAETLLKLRGSHSSIKLKRWGSRVQPICRALSGIVALFLIYRMLIQLGLPGNLVLALSSVPGLAIALGASKLLSNLFSGFSIQTDRPLRVGEFCRIGENLGYVTKIGLRSIEIQTVTSTVAIPNSVADDSIIVNYSDRQLLANNEHRQGVEIRVPINVSLTSGQVNQLLFFSNRYLEALDDLTDTRVNVEQTEGDELTITGFGYADVTSWNAYLEIRKAMFVRFKQIIAQVLMSRIVLRVAYQTSEAVRRRIPEQLKQIVCLDDQVTFGSCELLKISDYSYDFVFDFRSFHPTYGAFLKAVDRINNDLLAYVERENIVLPFPTSIFIQKPAELQDLRGVNPM